VFSILCKEILISIILAYILFLFICLRVFHDFNIFNLLVLPKFNNLHKKHSSIIIELENIYDLYNKSEIKEYPINDEDWLDFITELNKTNELKNNILSKNQSSIQIKEETNVVSKNEINKVEDTFIVNENKEVVTQVESTIPNKDYFEIEIIKNDDNIPKVKVEESYNILETLVQNDFANDLESSKEFFENNKLSKTNPQKIDWKELNELRKNIGDIGELIVIKYEKKKLLKLNMPEYAAKVEHSALIYGDGLGYDILSYNESAEEVYIEVKTTKGRNSEIINFTDNELKCMKEYGEKIYLYRIYDLNDIDYTAKVDIYKGFEFISNAFQFEVKNYKASFKK